MNRIYLDYAATTPVDPLVLKAMQPYFSENFANPSSLHTSGQQAKKAITAARQEVAAALGCSSSDVIFCGGGTESNNLAIFGTTGLHKTGHIITTAIEHDSVLEPCHELEKQGFRVTYLPVNNQGLISLDDLKKALSEDTILVSIIYANNEIGTIQPIAEIGKFLRNQDIAKNLAFHTDACQAAGALPLTVDQLNVDLLTLNGGKIYGPKGVGALYLKQDLKLKPQILGGNHERGLRAGTENIPGIIGLARALTLAQDSREAESARLTDLRNQLLAGIQDKLDQIIVNGTLDARLPNNLNLTVQGAEGESLLMRLDLAEIDASAGSACTAGNTEPSHVLIALGRSKQEAYQSIRFSLGKHTTPAEIQKTITIFTQIVTEIRQESGTY